MHSVQIGKIDELLPNALGQLAIGKIAVLIDENTAEYCLPLISSHIKGATIIQISSGEENKQLESCQTIWRQLTDASFKRNDLLINLGGGVITDMGGFCAATYMRGITFINVPTTLLSQVDASVGVKLGIDFDGLKNHIGLFKEPDRVIIDPVFLKTLPERELKSGYAEVIKHTLIRDKQGWEKLQESNFPDMNWKQLIQESVEIKKTVVEEDFRESGLRKILNFGHTLGHSLESTLLHSPSKLLHGEAIAAGMIMEAYLSSRVAGLSSHDLKSISSYLISLYGKVSLTDNTVQGMMKNIKMDKKNKENSLLFSLISEIGTAITDVQVPEKLVMEAIEYYKSNQT